MFSLMRTVFFVEIQTTLQHLCVSLSDAEFKKTFFHRQKDRWARKKVLSFPFLERTRHCPILKISKSVSFNFFQKNTAFPSPLVSTQFFSSGVVDFVKYLSFQKRNTIWRELQIWQPDFLGFCLFMSFTLKTLFNCDWFCTVPWLTFAHKYTTQMITAPLNKHGFLSSVKINGIEILTFFIPASNSNRILIADSFNFANYVYRSFGIVEAERRFFLFFPLISKLEDSNVFVGLTEFLSRRTHHQRCCQPFFEYETPPLQEKKK